MLTHNLRILHKLTKENDHLLALFDNCILCLFFSWDDFHNQVSTFYSA